jgi:DNA-binding NarL/FixJ family response regulator
MNLRILIADDHDLMRRGIKALLETHSGWEICAEATTGFDAVAKAKHLKPDVVVLDISLPDLNGIDATREIRKVSPNTEILILSTHYSDQLIREMVDAGVRGYVLKSDSDSDLAIAVDAVARHKPFFTEDAAGIILGEFNTGGPVAKIPIMLPERLTPREREIVKLIAEGKRSNEIAASLAISKHTVETHRNNIMHKLELHTLNDLVRYALRNQIIKA